MKSLLDSIWGTEDNDVIIITPSVDPPPVYINISCGTKPPEPPDYTIGGRICKM
jgi:hypothetical protein